MMNLQTMSESGHATLQSIPIYLDSPQLFVTSEHIMSESASTSSSGSLGGSGEVVELFGVDIFSA